MYEIHLKVAERPQCINQSFDFLAKSANTDNGPKTALPKTHSNYGNYIEIFHQQARRDTRSLIWNFADWCVLLEFLPLVSVTKNRP